jgi:hypothetical protein
MSINCCIHKTFVKFQQRVHPTKADADSTTDSPVPGSSPATLTAIQPPTLSNILAMRQRLHSKQQIALLHDVHSIRLIRERLTPKTTAAPTEDDVGAAKEQEDLEVVSLNFQNLNFQ